MANKETVSREDWLAARRELLEKERELTRMRDELQKSRLALPQVRIEKDYTFDGPEGRESLSDLFAGRSQLLIYHFMLGPEWEEGCKSCSYVSDHFDASTVHLAARDVSLVVVSRAPYERIRKFQDRLGWKFKWVSSYESDFNWDFDVSFTDEDKEKGEVYYNYQKSAYYADEGPGLSAFSREADGSVFHTYSAYARGLDLLIGTYNLLDMAPKGRNEDDLPWTMSWVRHHDRYCMEEKE